jgi:hypothetical protein
VVVRVSLGVVVGGDVGVVVVVVGVVVVGGVVVSGGLGEGDGVGVVLGPGSRIDETSEASEEGADEMASERGEEEGGEVGSPIGRERDGRDSDSGSARQNNSQPQDLSNRSGMARDDVSRIHTRSGPGTPRGTRMNNRHKNVEEARIWWSVPAYINKQMASVYRSSSANSPEKICLFSRTGTSCCPRMFALSWCAPA